MAFPEFTGYTTEFSSVNLFFLKNEDIFVEVDELDELNRIIHAWIQSNFSLTQAQKTL